MKFFCESFFSWPNSPKPKCFGAPKFGRAKCDIRRTKQVISSGDALQIVHFPPKTYPTDTETAVLWPSWLILLAK